jgi:type VI secretion system protein ImpL
MSRLWQFLTDSRVLAVIGLTAFLAFLFITAQTFEIALIWALIAGLVLLAGWGVF